jgi:exopolysaccharide biosynthesis polyprenyl glycosylphosphotransferase
LRRLLALADTVAIAAALGVNLAHGHRGTEHALAALAVVPMWILLMRAYGLYDADARRISHSTVDDIPRLFHVIVVGSLFMWLYFGFLPFGKLVFADVLRFGVMAAVVVLALRWIVRRTAARWLGPERVVLVGAEQGPPGLVRKMRSSSIAGLEPVGVIATGTPSVGELPVIGRLEDMDPATLAALVERHRVERLVVSHPGIASDTVMELLHACRELGLKVNLLPALSDAIGPSAELDHIEGIALLGISPPILSRSSRVAKRGLDLVGAAACLIVSAPVMLLGALTIKLDSRGPVLFAQQRVGRGGRRFRLYKFRTMVADAEARTQELLALSEDPDWLKLAHDPRITRVGQLLRVTSLDELPQLINVVRGDMSLVGPRPLIESEDSRVNGWVRGRLDLTPGMTGLWQVLGRTNIPFEEMVKLDYLYVTNWSLWGDLRLIMQTLPVVLSRRGAN